MGIWIRSQNKGVLCKANNLYLDEETVLVLYGGLAMLLGEYLTEAEAIQVLDMIQTHIVKIDDYHRTGCCEDWVDPVFQMPPAGFTEEG